MEFPIVGSEKLFLWALAPAIADVAIEYLRTSIHQRTQYCHLFVCPKLMTYKWRIFLLKTCDLSFYVDAGIDCWDVDMHESVLIAIYLPQLHCFPWTFRKSKSVLEVERTLRQMPSPKTRPQGLVLRKFLKFTRTIPTMPDGLVRKLLSEGFRG